MYKWRYLNYCVLIYTYTQHIHTISQLLSVHIHIHSTHIHIYTISQPLSVQRHMRGRGMDAHICAECSGTCRDMSAEARGQSPVLSFKRHPPCVCLVALRFLRPNQDISTWVGSLPHRLYWLAKAQESYCLRLPSTGITYAYHTPHYCRNLRGQTLSRLCMASI